MVAESTPRISNKVFLRWIPRICISTSSLVTVMLPFEESHFENYCIKEILEPDVSKPDYPLGVVC